jgi:hypothetical protein
LHTVNSCAEQFSPVNTAVEPLRKSVMRGVHHLKNDIYQ